MFVPPRLPDQEANCSLRKYDILMDPFLANRKSALRALTGGEQRPVKT